MIVGQGPILELEPDLIIVSPSEARHVTVPEVAEPADASGRVPVLKTLEEVERAHISAVLQHTHGVVEGVNGAAKTLGMHPNTLRHRMEKLGIKRSAHRA